MNADHRPGAPQPGARASRDPDQTGPVTPELIGRAWRSGMADAGTGPVPVSRRPGPPPADPGSVTAPHAVPGGRRGNPPRPVPRPRRPGRKASRDERVVAFVLNQFPIGHMPVAETSPSRQLPVPDEGSALVHPQQSVISEAGWPERVRAGAARTCPRPRGGSLPAALTENYRAHGDLDELEWERAFRTRSGTTWPSAEPPAEPVVLQPETIVDHFGDGFGRLLSPVGTPFAQRALPPETLNWSYRRFRVVRPVPVFSSPAEPWFGQPGGGPRYRTTCPVVELIALGHLLELTDEPDTVRLNTADGPGEDTR